MNGASKIFNNSTIFKIYLCGPRKKESNTGLEYNEGE